ncbi:MAG: cob(I)yrinic acid a,c-diamide adenosyltransferase [Nitrospirae bacterium]|nr:MAG: cob(I)yrinic acid a,c-diamide adenosyltransferase [Nitrospirota bacterium]
MKKKGLVHIYTGDGKGKTTAAIGISVRAAGAGLTVLFSQFFKEKVADSEIIMLERLGIDTAIFDSVKSPLFNPDISTDHLTRETRKSFDRIRTLYTRKEYDLLVLDEFICLIAEGVVSEEEALAFLESRPGTLEVVLTGNGASEKLMQYADYVTNMKNIKHPYSEKTCARKGIEY